MTQEKVGTYKQNYGSTGSRETDMRALLKCASMLNDALTDNGKDMAAYRTAIRQNQRLWTIFQIAISDAENPLPNELKQQLLNISRYIDKTSFASISHFNAEALKSLIGLNRTLASGLAKNNAPQGQQQAPMVAPPPASTGTPTSVMISA